jgi:hypothetical protein
VANNPHEASARRAFMEHYGGDPYKGLLAFADELSAALREGRAFRLPDKATAMPSKKAAELVNV